MLIKRAEPALERGESVSFITPVRNVNRTIGTMLSGEVARRYGHTGLPDDTIHVQCNGVAGQSFGAFLAAGITLDLVGEANDYVGKGLSGGRIIVRSPNDFRGFGPDHIIAGNTVLYGAIAGEAYFNGVAGERFAVRNSGPHGRRRRRRRSRLRIHDGWHGRRARQDGTQLRGRHVGRRRVRARCRQRLRGSLQHVDGRTSSGSSAARSRTPSRSAISVVSTKDLLRELLEKHFRYTGSFRARELLATWETTVAQFVRVMPSEYRRVLKSMNAASASAGEQQPVKLAA